MANQYVFLINNKNIQKYRDIIISIFQKKFYKRNKHFQINKSPIGPIVFLSNEFQELCDAGVVFDTEDGLTILNGAVFEAYIGPANDYFSDTSHPEITELVTHHRLDLKN